jgi:hypothetical protein
MRTRSTLLLALLATAPAAAQCTWLLSSTGGPPARQNHGAAFDSVRNVLVIFGGYNGTAGGFKSDTWIWDDESWQQVAVGQIGPSARGNHAMAFDTARGVVVLFGGAFGGSSASDETWEWNGTSWTLRSLPASPPARFNHAMAYDSARGVMVVTGGFSTQRWNDTWEYNGTTWTQRSGTNYVARSSHAMAFDAARNRMVIFGGFGGSPLSRLADTWELTATGWQLAPATGPSGRQYTNMDFNPQRNVIVLFGGQTGPLGTDRVNDLWSYNGAAWTLDHPGTPFPDPVPANQPNRRDQHTVTYDRARNKLLVVGGYQGATTGGVAGDTWSATCAGGTTCYANCDSSTTAPILNVGDFTCFLQRFAAGDSYANCDQSTQPPVLNVGDFTCFLQSFAAGCP